MRAWQIDDGYEAFPSHPRLASSHRPAAGIDLAGQRRLAPVGEQLEQSSTLADIEGSLAAVVPIL